MKSRRHEYIKLFSVFAFLIGLFIYIFFIPKTATQCILMNLEDAKSDTSAKLLSSACHREYPQKK
tara:strand:- start:1015 stop:1209 length:195 start_codon:yes stop_codon:yes gene_type:complete